MKKKLVSALLSVAMVASLLLTGCGGGDSAATNNDSSAGTEETAASTTEEAAPEASSTETSVIDAGAGEGATELEYWTFVELHGQHFETMLQKWNEANPDRQIKLNVTVMPYDDMHNKLLIAVQTGEGAPDISDIEFPEICRHIFELAFGQIGVPCGRDVLPVRYFPVAVDCGYAGVGI